MVPVASAPVVPLSAEELGHEVSVQLRHAEGQGARGGAAVFAQLLVGVAGAGLRRDVAGQLLFVEARVAPGDGAVVHLVGDAVVVEAAEQVAPDALDQVTAVGEVFLAEREQIAAVGALRGGGEAEEELGAEPVDEAAVGRGGRVVEFVDDDVVEGVALEALEMSGAPERLDRGEEDLGVGVAVRPLVEAEARLGADEAIGVARLAEDLLAVGDEEDPAILGAVRVEGAEPGLAEAGREDDEPGGVPGGAGFIQRRERRELDCVRCDDCPRFGLDIDGRGRGPWPGGDLPALPVAVDPRGRQLPRRRVVKEALEDLGDAGESRGVRRGDRAVAPFDAGQERRLGEVGAADKGDAVAAGAG